MYDVKTSVNIPKQTIRPEMLVKFNPEYFQGNEDDVGIVVQVTKHLVHVLWLVNTSPGALYSKGAKETLVTNAERKKFFATRGQYHYVTEEKHRDLIPAPQGTKVTITQTLKV